MKQHDIQSIRGPLGPYVCECGQESATRSEHEAHERSVLPLRAGELIRARLEELKSKGLYSLVPPYLGLLEVLDGLELEPRAAQFLQWVMGFDGTTVTGLIALLKDARTAAFCEGADAVGKVATR